MAVINTTDVIDSSMFLKARLDKNMVGTNYYIENLQHKRNADWNYRYNVVGIEEELHKQVNYTNERTSYTPIDVVITEVKNDRGEPLGTDWAHIAFRDLKHPCGIGYRYRFSLDFPDMRMMNEEDKHYKTSVWIGVNKSPIKGGNSCTIRRCNTALAFVGSPTRDYNNVTEVHYEPAILETEMRYLQVYYNQTIPVPQAEWYAIMQMNYFTNNVKINDRFVFNVTDTEVRENNHVYKVKAVVKSTAKTTFVKNEKAALRMTDLVILALDRDMVAPDDNLETRVAETAPIYKAKSYENVYEYYLRMEEPYASTVLLAETEEYTVNMYYNDEVVEGAEFTMQAYLDGIDEEFWGDYFDFNQTDINKFTIKNLKTCLEGPLKVKVMWSNSPAGLFEEEQIFEFELGSFY